mmetsp:Transcript_61146/g.138331  ORF Transcript_61146/g.138331 Transcript_61146/m.138331 type:complete len:513 (+) Transcript_61146:226-1764(+)
MNRDAIFNHFQSDLGLYRNKWNRQKPLRLTSILFLGGTAGPFGWTRCAGHGASRLRCVASLLKGARPQRRHELFPGALLRPCRRALLKPPSSSEVAWPGGRAGGGAGREAERGAARRPRRGQPPRFVGGRDLFPGARARGCARGGAVEAGGGRRGRSEAFDLPVEPFDLSPKARRRALGPICHRRCRHSCVPGVLAGGHGRPAPPGPLVGLALLPFRPGESGPAEVVAQGELLRVPEQGGVQRPEAEPLPVLRQRRLAEDAHPRRGLGARKRHHLQGGGGGGARGERGGKGAAKLFARRSGPDRELRGWRALEARGFDTRPVPTKDGPHRTTPRAAARGGGGGFALGPERPPERAGILDGVHHRRRPQKLEPKAAPEAAHGPVPDRGHLRPASSETGALAAAHGLREPRGMTGRRLSGRLRGGEQCLVGGKVLGCPPRLARGGREGEEVHGVAPPLKSPHMVGEALGGQRQRQQNQRLPTTLRRPSRARALEARGCFFLLGLRAHRSARRLG